MHQFGFSAVSKFVPANHSDRIKHVFEVIALSCVNHIDHAIALEILHAELACRKIGGGVQESAVTLANEHGAFAVWVANHNGAIVFDAKSTFGKCFYCWSQSFAEEAFAATVLISELNAKNSGGFKDFLHGAVNDLLPLGHQLRVARLQSNKRGARVFLGKRGAGVLCLKFCNSMRTNTGCVRGDHAGGIVTAFKLRGAVGTIEIFKRE